jgi:hypothetical protein
MPKGEVSITGLAAFGAGVAVGANWPRASNLVVYLLKRLGVELTDLAFWMWEPEQGAGLSRETAATARPQAQGRPRARRVQDANPTNDKPRAQATKTARSPSAQSGAAAVRTSRKGATRAHPSRMMPKELNHDRAARTGALPVHSPLLSSNHTGGKAGRVKPDLVYTRSVQPTKGIPPNGHKATNPSLTRPEGTAMRTSPTKPKRAAIKGKGKTPSARPGRKTRGFPAAVSPAAAALN